jgi:hypothetical protein
MKLFITCSVAILLTLSACQKETKVTEVLVTAAPPPPPIEPEPLEPTPGKDCAWADEYGALNVRGLQTELTVGALTCGERERYTQFVKTFRPQLILQAKLLRQYFKRHYKKEGNFRLDQFVTRVANAYANRTKFSRIDFCAKTRDLFNQINAKPSANLAELTRGGRYSSVHGIGQCKKTAEEKVPPVKGKSKSKTNAKTNARKQ